MESANTYEGLDPLAANTVRRHARELVRSGAIPLGDLEDAEQDLMVHALAKLDRHDRRLGMPSVYLDRIVRSKAQNMAEERRAARRAPERRAAGLEHGLSLHHWEADYIDEETIRAVTPTTGRSHVEDLHLRIDLEGVLASLPEDQRSLANALREKSVADVARDLGVGRATIYDRLKPIRDRLVEAGVGEYLHPSGSDASPPSPVAFCGEGKSRGRGSAGAMANRTVTTYSMWSLFRNCRKAVEWRYIHELVPLSRDANLGFGTVIHKCLELWHGQRDLAAVLAFVDGTYPARAYDEDQRREWHLATAMMTAYAAKYAQEEFEVVSLEQVFEGEIVNPATKHPSRSFVLKGKVDGIVKRGGEYFLLEHKTAAQMGADYLERLWTDFQVTLYAHYVEQALGIRISGIIYNILVKAKLQQSRGETEAEYEARHAELAAKAKSGKSSAKRRMPETDEEFQARLAEKYAEPDMLHREVLYLSRERFEVLRSELWELTQAYLEAKRRGVFYQNTAFCFHHGKPCPFFALCRSNGNPNVIENFYQRVPANEELRGEAEPTAAEAV